MEELEKRFIKLFANGDRKKGMTVLKAFRQPASHKVTFFLLLKVKWFQKDELLDEEKDLYLTAMFPLFRFVH